MRTIDLLCLANSKKLGGRCLAGLVLPEMTEWVRLVDCTRIHGEVPHNRVEIQAPEGRRPVRPLDVIRVELTGPQPTPFQPENWILGPAPIELIKVADLASILPALEAISYKGHSVLDLSGEKSLDSHSASQGLSRSIELISVRNAKCRKDNWNRWRIDFRFGSFTYQYVSITDYEWIKRLEEHPGSVPHHPDIDTRDSWLLTVSLTEEYQGRHWLVVAACISVQPES